MNHFYTFLNKLSHTGPYVMRIVLGLVFLYFGYTGITSPDMWTRMVPEWTNQFIGPLLLVQVHAWFEVIFGLLLIINWKPRIIATILFLNLLHTVTLLNFGPTMVRDIGLLAALYHLAVVPNKYD